MWGAPTIILTIGSRNTSASSLPVFSDTLMTLKVVDAIIIQTKIIDNAEDSKVDLTAQTNEGKIGFKIAEEEDRSCCYKQKKREFL